MPTLDWLNRDQAFRVANRVPTRVLRPHVAGAQIGDASSGNLLVQGDNLEALKALLPFYRGGVKCIFIDPPYNTKSAFEHYDDNLEHSAWLTMMLPRLQLLRELLSEDGSIWVTIDDNEGHYLKVLMDEVFGRRNFVANAIWRSSDNSNNDAKTFSVDHNLTDLEDGGEEWRCALAIDEHPAVRRWARNLDSDPVAGFWLPTSSGRFYPDFVCELNDGRLFVAEYKGAQLRDMPKEIEKAQVGRVWSEHSGGSCVFAMLFKMDHGMNLAQQIDAALSVR